MPTKIFRPLIFGICCFLLGYAAAYYFKPESVMERFGIDPSHIGFLQGLALQSEVAHEQGQVFSLQIESNELASIPSSYEATQNTGFLLPEGTAGITAESTPENASVTMSEDTSESTSLSSAENTSENSIGSISKDEIPTQYALQDASQPAAKVLPESTDSAILQEEELDSWPSSHGLSPAISSRFAKLALVIDDVGYSYSFAEKILRMNLPVTWAIIPEAGQSRKIADLAVDHGQPFLLRVPMQAIGDKDGSSQYVIGVDTSEDKIADYLAALQEKFPEAIGINNHRGSKATADSQTMLRFMNAYSATGWGFLDSHTTAKTIANKVAADYDIPVVVNCVFIDEKPNLAAMKKKFYDALRTAEEHGNAVAICHAREAILPFLKYLSKNEFAPVTFVTVDELWGDQKVYNRGGKK